MCGARAGRGDVEDSNDRPLGHRSQSFRGLAQARDGGITLLVQCIKLLGNLVARHRRLLEHVGVILISLFNLLIDVAPCDLDLGEPVLEGRNLARRIMQRADLSLEHHHGPRRLLRALGRNSPGGVDRLDLLLQCQFVHAKSLEFPLGGRKLAADLIDFFPALRLKLVESAMKRLRGAGGFIKFGLVGIGRLVRQLGLRPRFCQR
jgi:hypothetical protein